MSEKQEDCTDCKHCGYCYLRRKKKNDEPCEDFELEDWDKE